MHNISTKKLQVNLTKNVNLKSKERNKKFYYD